MSSKTKTINFSEFLAKLNVDAQAALTKELGEMCNDWKTQCSIRIAPKAKDPLTRCFGCTNRGQCSHKPKFFHNLETNEQFDYCPTADNFASYKENKIYAQFCKRHARKTDDSFQFQKNGLYTDEKTKRTSNPCAAAKVSKGCISRCKGNAKGGEEFCNQCLKPYETNGGVFKTAEKFNDGNGSIKFFWQRFGRHDAPVSWLDKYIESKKKKPKTAISKKQYEDAEKTDAAIDAAHQAAVARKIAEMDAAHKNAKAARGSKEGTTTTV